MRKKAVAQVYTLIKVVYDLEKELNRDPQIEDVRRELREARRQLHEVLNKVSHSGDRARGAA